MKYFLIVLAVISLQGVTTSEASAQSFQLTPLSVFSTQTSIKSISLSKDFSLSLRHATTPLQPQVAAPNVQNTQMQIAMLQSQRRGKAGGIILLVLGVPLLLVGIVGVLFISIILGSIVGVLGLGLVIGGAVLISSANRTNSMIDMQIQQLMMGNRMPVAHSSPVMTLAF